MKPSKAEVAGMQERDTSGDWHWVIDDLKLSLEEKAVLLTLLRHQGKTAGSWPSIGRIALLLGRHQRTVQRILAGLHARGYLEIERRYRRTNCYRVAQRQELLQLGKRHQERSEATPVPPLSDTSATPERHQRHPPPDTSVTPPLTPVSPRRGSMKRINDEERTTDAQDSTGAGSPKAVECWRKTLARIRALANPQTYATWFATTQALRLEGSNGDARLVVRAPNRVARCWLASPDGRKLWEPLADLPVEFVTTEGGA